MAMGAAFVVGIVSGAITMAFILSTTTDVPLFTFHLQTSFFIWFAENSRPIAATALALVMTLGMMSIISNVQDIVRIQRVMRQETNPSSMVESSSSLFAK